MADAPSHDATAAATTDPPPRANARVPLWRRIVWDLMWFGVGVGLFAAIARLLAHDANLLFVWLNSFSLYLYAPALVVLPLAWINDRPRLAAAALPLCVAFFAWNGGDFAPARASLFPTGDLTRIRVFSANLYADNATPAGILEEIRRADADLLLLQEYSPAWHDRLQAADIGATYPHHLVEARTDSFGTAIYSKKKLEQTDVWQIEGVPIARATIRIAARPVRVVNWHPLPPLNFEYVRTWRTQYDALLREIDREEAPVLICGDFNATQHARPYRELLERGFHTAHGDGGRGYAVTYPNGMSWTPPIRIDHAVFSPELFCHSIREGEGAGSDHKPLIFEIGFAPGE